MNKKGTKAALRVGDLVKIADETGWWTIVRKRNDGWLQLKKTKTVLRVGDLVKLAGETGWWLIVRKRKGWLQLSQEIANGKYVTRISALETTVTHHCPRSSMNATAALETRVTKHCPQP